MSRTRMHRAARAFGLVGLIVGVVTAGLATQASAITTPNPHVVGGFGQSVNPNKSISVAVNEDIGFHHTLVVSVATGTFAGEVRCTDDDHNHYDVVADRNTGNGRLFVCVGRADDPMDSGTHVTATYPGFSGVSAISVVEFDIPLEADLDDASTGFGSNPPVNSGPLCLFGQYLLFGVAANTNVSTFVADTPPWLDLLPTQSGGGGASKRTLTPEWQDFQPGGCSNKALTGHLTGSGFWQAAIVALHFEA